MSWNNEYFNEYVRKLDLTLSVQLVAVAPQGVTIRLLLLDKGKIIYMFDDLVLTEGSKIDFGDLTVKIKDNLF